MLYSNLFAMLIIPIVALVSIFSTQAEDSVKPQVKLAAQTGIKSVAETSKVPANKPHNQDKMLQAFYKMSPQIENIKQVCPWRSATARGVIRLMKTKDKGAHKLYVQWVRDGIAGMSKMPLSTLAISEINDENYFRFDLPEGRLLTGACSIETILEDVITEKRFHLTLHLMGPGQYEAHLTRLIDATL
jgi:hypothetical protein